MVVKLSTPWNLNYDQQLIFLQKQDDFCFEVNNFCNNCDVWIIWGGLNKAEEVNVPPENIIYIADECYAERSYNKEFLSQFNKIASVGSNIGIDNKINIHELTIWYFKNKIDILSLEKTFINDSFYYHDKSFIYDKESLEKVGYIENENDFILTDDPFILEIL